MPEDSSDSEDFEDSEESGEEMEEEGKAERVGPLSFFFFCRWWLYSHASYAVSFSDMTNLNILIVGTQGP